MERFCAPGSTEIGCWAITQPDHNSDALTFTEGHWSDPGLRPNCVAVPDGDHYVIRGQKSSRVSNGTMATVATLFCTIKGDEGFSGGGVRLVPLDLPGVSRGKPLDKLGQRALNQGEIFFDEVRRHRHRAARRAHPTAPGPPRRPAGRHCERWARPQRRRHDRRRRRGPVRHDPRPVSAPELTPGPSGTRSSTRVTHEATAPTSCSATTSTPTPMSRRTRPASRTDCVRSVSPRAATSR
ncbi:MAG: hypothetical protein FJW88_00405 [Actinobacteria bacterium]|nr:hypothetical protein [Actinomycetota bacterium]